MTTTSTKRPFRIRTITAFVTFTSDDFFIDEGTSKFYNKMNNCIGIVRKLETNLTDSGYEVQTVRIATNPFGEWLTQGSWDGDDDNLPLRDGAEMKKDDSIAFRLRLINDVLDTNGINFFSFGPSTNPYHTTAICPQIVATSDKFSCSANIDFGDIDSARAAASCMKKISVIGSKRSHLKGGLGNFRFCAVSCVDTVPFFPGAKTPSNDSSDRVSFSIGLENGNYARKMFLGAKSIHNIKSAIHSEMRKDLLPIQEICFAFVNDIEYSTEFLGIDTRYILCISLYHRNSFPLTRISSQSC